MDPRLARNKRKHNNHGCNTCRNTTCVCRCPSTICPAPPQCPGISFAAGGALNDTLSVTRGQIVQLFAVGGGGGGGGSWINSPGSEGAGGGGGRGKYAFNPNYIVPNDGLLSFVIGSGGTGGTGGMTGNNDNITQWGITGGNTTISFTPNGGTATVLITATGGAGGRPPLPPNGGDDGGGGGIWQVVFLSEGQGGAAGQGQSGQSGHAEQINGSFFNYTIRGGDGGRGPVLPSTITKNFKFLSGNGGEGGKGSTGIIRIDPPNAVELRGGAGGGAGGILPANGVIIGGTNGKGDGAGTGGQGWGAGGGGAGLHITGGTNGGDGAMGAVGIFII